MEKLTVRPHLYKGELKVSPYDVEKQGLEHIAATIYGVIGGAGLWYFINPFAGGVLAVGSLVSSFTQGQGSRKSQEWCAKRDMVFSSPDKAGNTIDSMRDEWEEIFKTKEDLKAFWSMLEYCVDHAQFSEDLSVYIEYKAKCYYPTTFMQRCCIEPYGKLKEKQLREKELEQATEKRTAASVIKKFFVGETPQFELKSAEIENTTAIEVESVDLSDAEGIAESALDKPPETINDVEDTGFPEVEDSEIPTDDLTPILSEKYLNHAPILDKALTLPLEKRARLILETLTQQGFPIQSLLRRTLIVSEAPSQSGKSTIIHLLNILRLACGIPVEYSSPDDDVPNIAFTKFHGTDWGTIRKAYVDTTERISTGKKRELQTAFTFDEFYRASSEGIDTNPLLRVTLQKGSKVKAYMTLITQDFTLKALNATQIGRDALDNSATMIYPEFTEDADGERVPTGKYRVTQGNSSNVWKLPKWLLEGEKDKWGNPDPVATFLLYFPELVKQETVEEVEETLEETLVQETTPIQLVSTLSDSNPPQDPATQRFVQWLSDKQGKQYTLRNLVTNWGNRNGATTNDAMQKIIDETLCHYRLVMLQSEQGTVYEVK